MVGEQRGELVRGIARVMLHHHRAQAQNGEECHHVLRAIRQQKRHTVAGAHAHLAQGTGRGRHLGIELAIGQRLASEVGGGALGKPRDGCREEIRQGSAIVNFCHSR